MSARQWTVGPKHSGWRLEKFLAKMNPQSGRSDVRDTIARGEARINGTRNAKGKRLQLGDVVTLERPVEALAAQPDEGCSLEVRYEDRWMVVVEKPAGIATHPLRGGELGTAANALVARYPEMAPVGYEPRQPGVVHRLDRDTSGLLIAARSEQAFERLRNMLEHGEIEKQYAALCWGTLQAPQTLHAQLAAHRTDRRRMEVVRPGIAYRGKPWHAHTEIVRSEPVGAWSLVDARANKAARHQLRVQLAHAGHPLAGDTLYGGPALNGLRRHFLHASAVRFAHPFSGACVDVQSPLPAELRRALDNARNHT